MKLGQLIVYNMRNIFLKNHTQNGVEKLVLFHLKNSFCSPDIKGFVLTFWSCRKNGLIRKIGLPSRFMTSQPG